MTKNRIISIVLIITFIALDAAWAYPSEPKENSNLATQVLSQQKMMTEAGAVRKDAVFGDIKLVVSTMSIAKALLLDKLPLKYLKNVLTVELGPLLFEGIDLSSVSVKGGVVVIPFRTYEIHIALKDSPQAKALKGWDWPAAKGTTDEYTAKVLPRSSSAPAPGEGTKSFPTITALPEYASTEETAFEEDSPLRMRLPLYDGIAIYDNRRVETKNGVSEAAEELTGLIRVALIDASKITRKRGPPIAVHVLPSVPTNIQKRIENGNVHFLLDERFIKTLLSYRSRYPNAVPRILAERLAHEFSHNDTTGTDREEAIEERDVIINTDLPFYRMLCAQPGLKDEVDRFFDETGISFKGKRYFKLLLDAIKDLPPDQIRLAVEGFIDCYYNFGFKFGKLFPAGTDVPAGVMKYQNPRDPKLQLDEYDRRYYQWDGAKSYWYRVMTGGKRVVLGTWEDIKSSSAKDAAPTDMEFHVAIRMIGGWTAYIFDAHSYANDYLEEAIERGEARPKDNQQIFIDNHPDTQEIGDPDARIAKGMAEGGALSNHIWVFFGAHTWPRPEGILGPDPALEASGVKNNRCYYEKYFEVRPRPRNTRAVFNIDTDAASSGSISEFLKEVRLKDNVAPAAVFISTSPPNCTEKEANDPYVTHDGFMYPNGFGSIKICADIAKALPFIFNGGSVFDRTGYSLGIRNIVVGGREITFIDKEEINPDLIRPQEIIVDKGHKKPGASQYAAVTKLFKDGKVGLITVAGGMSSRAGIDYPKGMHPIAPLSKKTLFQLRAEELSAARQRYGRIIPWFIMTSSSNDMTIRKYFEQNKFFGLGRKNVIFIMQKDVAALESGTTRPAMKDEQTLFVTPNGHGGIYRAIRDARARTDGGKISALAEAKKRSVDTFLYCQIDNAAPVINEFMIDNHVKSGSDFTTVLVRKRDPKENIGMLAQDKVSGVPFFVEYNQPAADIIREMQGYEYGSIARFVFSYDFLATATPPPYHYIRDKSAKIYADGILRDGLIDKFERFVFDAQAQAHTAINVCLERDECFAPFKSMAGPDSHETAANTMSDLCKKWLVLAGSAEEVSAGSTLEFSSAFAVDAADVEKKIGPGFKVIGNSEIYLGGSDIKIGRDVAVSGSLKIEFEDPYDGQVRIPDSSVVDSWVVFVKKGERVVYGSVGKSFPAGPDAMEDIRGLLNEYRDSKDTADKKDAILNKMLPLIYRTHSFIVPGEAGIFRGMLQDAVEGKANMQQLYGWLKAHTPMGLIGIADSWNFSVKTKTGDGEWYSPTPTENTITDKSINRDTHITHMIAMANSILNGHYTKLRIGLYADIFGKIAEETTPDVSESVLKERLQVLSRKSLMPQVLRPLYLAIILHDYGRLLKNRVRTDPKYTGPDANQHRIAGSYLAGDLLAKLGMSNFDIRLAQLMIRLHDAAWCLYCLDKYGKYDNYTTYEGVMSQVDRVIADLKTEGNMPEGIDTESLKRDILKAAAVIGIADVHASGNRYVSNMFIENTMEKMVGSKLPASAAKSFPAGEEDIRQGIRKHLAALLASGIMDEEEYKKLLPAVDTYDLTPFMPLIEKTRALKDSNMDAFLSSLLATVAAGYRPVIAADFDDVLTPFGEELGVLIRDILSANGKFIIITGTPKKELDRRALGTDAFRNVFTGNEKLLEHLYLFPKTGAELWVYKDGYKLTRSMSLAEELGKIDGRGNILPKEKWDTKRGQEIEDRYKAMLREAIDVFGLTKGIPGHEVNGDMIEDRGSQINMQTMGVSASDAVKDAYRDYENGVHKKQGFNIRELCATFINFRMGQLYPEHNADDARALEQLKKYMASRNISLPQPTAEEQKIPMINQRGGRTNLNGILLGMDKGWGVLQAAMMVRQPAWTITFCADALFEGGNDRAGMMKAGVTINVGDAVEKPPESAFLINSDKRGPMGLFPYYKMVKEVFEVSDRVSSGISYLILLARKAKRENQKLIIGLETDWIPAMNIKDSLQRNAIAALMKEIDGLGETLRSMGLDNVEVIRGSGEELSGALLKEAGRTHTGLHNVVVMASANTINSPGFEPLRNASESDRPFLAGIDPTELIRFYTEFGEATSKQLYIRLAGLLYMTLELATGKEPPQLPMIVSYDKNMRMVIYLPKAEPKDYQMLKDIYSAEKAAMAAA